ncbi:transcriptional regulator [Aquimarina sp. RZ0]|uniref:transcriptional regulator n=1 Tax=Aquimarina sp. RZ0 TaxID=2607730 RepID=UPI00165F7FF9|nr:transcriptional regulator [Aquimarina sp. RZ0]
MQITDSLHRVISNKNTRDTTLLKAYNDLGIQYVISDPARAKRYIHQALSIAKRLQNSRGIAGANNCMGVTHYYQKEYDSALVYFNKSYRINQDIKHIWGQASSLNQIGAIYNHTDQYTEAIESLTKAGILFLKVNDSLSFIKSIENKGVSYKRTEQYEKAIECYLYVLRWYERYNKTEGIRRSYIHISTVLIKQEQYKKALKYLDQALLRLEKNNQILRSSITLNIGTCYNGLKQYDTALTYFKKAFVYRKTTGNPKTIAYIQSLIGATYYEMQDYGSSLIFQKKALYNYTTAGDNKQKNFTINELAKCFVKTNQLDSAKIYALKALDMTKNICDLDGEKESLIILAQIAEQNRNTKDAVLYYKNLIQLKDSLKNLANEKKARELQAEYENEKKEQQIVSKDKKINLLRQKTKNKKLQPILLVIILLVSILILSIKLFCFKKKIKCSLLERKKLKAELDFRNKELTTHALHIVKKNTVLENLKQEVKDIKYSENQDLQYKYLKLLQTINFEQKDAENWNNFRKCFEEVHQDFYTIVMQKYPNVTANELRLMALLKLNLSSKEIAKILNISLEGIKKARYRLRKKIGINKKSSLRDHIHSI